MKRQIFKSKHQTSEVKVQRSKVNAVGAWPKHSGRGQGFGGVAKVLGAWPRPWGRGHGRGGVPMPWGRGQGRGVVDKVLGA